MRGWPKRRRSGSSGDEGAPSSDGYVSPTADRLWNSTDGTELAEALADADESSGFAFAASEQFSSWGPVAGAAPAEPSVEIEEATPTEPLLPEVVRRPRPTPGPAPATPSSEPPELQAPELQTPVDVMDEPVELDDVADGAVEPAEPEEPADVLDEAVEPAEPEEPADVLDEAVEPEEPADVLDEAVEPEEPADVLDEAVEPAEPAEPEESAEPEEPTDVVDEAVAPAEPGESGELDRLRRVADILTELDRQADQVARRIDRDAERP